MNKDSELNVEDLLIWSDKNTNNILKDLCREYKISEQSIVELVHWQRERQQMTKSRNRNATFDEIFENEDYWNS